MDDKETWAYNTLVNALPGYTNESDLPNLRTCLAEIEGENNSSGISESATSSAALDEKWTAARVIALNGKTADCPKAIQGDGYNYTPDFMKVTWFGKPYQFRPGQQAQAIGHLLVAFENGRCGISDLEMGELLGSDNAFDSSLTQRGQKPEGFRLDNLFRIPAGTKKERHAAWGTMIIRVAERTYRLEKPA